MEYEALIGLEVHAQIHTRSKMFCACPVMEDTGDLPPNTYVCPVCTAMPGTLPVINRRAVELTLMTGLALLFFSISGLSRTWNCLTKPPRLMMNDTPGTPCRR